MHLMHELITWNQASFDVLEEFLKSVARDANSKEIDGKEKSKEEECDDSKTREKTTELQDSEEKRKNLKLTGL